MKDSKRIQNQEASGRSGASGVVRGGRVVEAASTLQVPFDPQARIGEDRDEVRDLFIRDGKISEAFDGPYDFEIDASDLLVMPGFVDLHCHLRDPGQEYKEDILSGAASAAAGGFTSIACMPNTVPVIDNKAIVSYVLDKAKAAAVHVYPIGAVTKRQDGVELAEMGQMKQAGIVAVSDDGAPVSTADRMLKGMQYASDFGLVVIDHCEEPSLRGGTMNEGSASTRMGEHGIPSVAEDIIVARDILIAEYLDLPVHLAHVSTARSISLIREAKARGVKVTAETCPHYFSLTEEACLSFNGLFRVNPPLRREEDRLAVIEGLKDGTLDCLATDHAPHHKDEKEIEFSLAKNGMIGFETAFALAWTWLVEPGTLTATDLVRILAANPAAFLRISAGSLQPGSPADLTIADPQARYTYDRSKAVSKSKNSPYDGFALQGKIVATITGGRLVYQA
ncbi:MAG: dihydroorotase [Clostridia bacterium]|nr:dihydroorotase [Clostridia bacterium]